MTDVQFGQALRFEIIVASVQEPILATEIEGERWRTYTMIACLIDIGA